MANYLVTGAAGFIGSKVVQQLVERGDTVVGVDNVNDAYDVRLKEWRIRQIEALPGVRFCRADICDNSAMSNVFSESRFDAVLNLAARAGVRQSVADPHVYIETNVTGTLNLLRLSVQHDVPKFVLASTSSLYGGDNPRPYVETLNTDHPLSPYAASKKGAEALCFTYHYLFGIDVTVLRYFTVYGPAGRPDMALFRFVQWITEGKPVTVFGDGRQERDFTYVDDVARGTIAGLKPLGYEVINLGSDTPVMLADAIKVVEECTGKAAKLVSEPRHPADVLATWANISKAQNILSWRPQTQLREGVRNLVEWYNENRAWTGQVLTE